MQRQPQTRRAFLKTTGAAALAATMSSCASPSVGNPVSGYRRPYSRNPWVAPRISRDRIVRVVVGSRPYRPSGFVVKGERMGALSLV